MTSNPLRRSARIALVALGTGSVLASVALGSGAGGAAAASFTPPGYVRSVGGTGTAGVYAWGIQYDAATNQIEVADYWNFYVRSYSPAGQQMNSFYQSAATRQGQPESIAVNPANGDIFVAENGTQKSAGYIAHFSDTGTYIGEINTRSEYTAWIAIDNSNHLFVVNGHLSGSSRNPNRVQEYDISQASDPEINSWGTYGTGNCDFIEATGLATDAAGHVYVADAQNYYVAEFTPSTSPNGGATCVQDIGNGQGRALGQYVGDLRGVAINQAQNLLYVSDAAGYRIDEFNIATTPPTPVAIIGSQGTGNGQFGDGARQIAVDSSGNLWAADYSNFRFEEFSPTGTFMAVYPNPAEPPAPGFLSEARDVAVNPSTGTVWVADSWSDRFQEFSSDGTFLGAWGHRGSTAPYGLDYPRGIGVDPATGNVWVADTRDYVIRIYDQNGNYLTSIGSGTDSSSPGSFEAPDGVTFYGGDAYISDYWSCVVTVWTAPANPAVTAPTYIRQINGCNFGVAVDPATGNTYVVDQSRSQVREYSPSGSFITQWGSYGTGSGQFESAWHAVVLNGVVYVTDTKRNNVQAFDTSGHYLGQWGGTGTGAFQFNQPSGIATDAAGNIYVASANQGRIQVFSESVPLPSGDTTPPTVAMTSPVSKQVVPAATVTITGTATDNVGVGDLEVAVHNAVTNLWWDGSHSNWTKTKTWNYAAPVCDSLTSCTFSFGFVGETFSTKYTAQVRALDTSGNSAMGPLVAFTIASS
jgi:tripartite motif-containing protein 71